MASSSKHVGPIPAPSPTLALVCASIHTGASRGLWAGFVDEALSRGCNVICLPGGRLGAAEAFEAQRNAIFDLASARNADGIASWTTSLSGAVSSAELEAFLCRFTDIPLVSLSQALPGKPLVAFDAYEGMRALIEHLIDAHGYSGIAFIRGPATHVSADQRYKAYLDVLAERRIPFRPELVSGPYPWDAGAEAARTLLDLRRLKPGPDFRAMAAASDLLAFSAMREFLSRGFRIPEDVAMCGFNDSMESQLASPALTTVVVDFEREGRMAADILLRGLAGEAPPSETILPSEIKLRRSCGCPTAILDEGEELAPCLPAAGPIRRAFIAELAVLLGSAPAQAAVWLEPLLDGLLVDIKSGSSSAFFASLEPALDRTSPEGLDPAGWQAALSLLRRRALSSAPQETARIEKLFHRARALAAETSRRAETYAHWREEEEAETLRSVGASLLVSHDVQRIAVVLAESLPRLGIPSAYLVLEEEGAPKARLIAAAGEGLAFGPSLPGLPFDRDLLLPREVLPHDRNFAFIVEPLFFRDSSIGRLVLEIGPRDGTVYEELRGYVSSALRGAALFGEAEEARRRAEKADRIKTRLLANLSRELCEPLERIISAASGADMRRAKASAVEGIKADARRQLLLIEELLDLSRADSGELELEYSPVDIAALLEAITGHHFSGPSPLIKGDEKRLGQVFKTLLALGPEALDGEGPSLQLRIDLPHFIVETGGPGGEESLDENSESEVSHLGLSMARRLLALHEASLEVLPPHGFRVSFPLPSLEPGTEPKPSAELGPLLCLSRSRTFSAQALSASAAGGEGPRAIIVLSSIEDFDEGLESWAGPLPSALLWDLDEALPADWELARALRLHAFLSRLPLWALSSSHHSLFPAEASLKASRPADDFLSLLEARFSPASSGPAFVIASNQGLRDELCRLLGAAFPNLKRRSFVDSGAALLALDSSRPAFLMGDSAAARSWYAGFRSRGADIPTPSPSFVVFLGEDEVDWSDLLELDATFLIPRGLLPEAVLRAVLENCMRGGSSLPPHTALLVRRAELWLVRHFSGPVSRSDLAASVGANEDYLSRIFHQELGLSPWEFLGRYRICRARLLLESGDSPLAEIAARVGFSDQAYFSRVFRKYVGKPPLASRSR